MQRFGEALYGLQIHIFKGYFPLLQAQPKKEEPKKEAEEEAKPSYALIPSAMKKPAYVPTVSGVPTPRTPDINSGISVDPNASTATQQIQRELQVSPFLVFLQ